MSERKGLSANEPGSTSLRHLPSNHDDASRWVLAGSSPQVIEDPRSKDLWEEAQAAAPPGMFAKHEQFMPRRKTTGRCRICGENRPLTREHIPPQSSGNRQATVSHSYETWLQSVDLELPDRGPVHQNGIWGYTLCADCNSLTGRRYGAHYSRWVALANGVLADLPAPSQLDQLTQPLGWNMELGSAESGGVCPGALVRQVLSCMCSLSGTWDLAGIHPEIRRIVLKDSLEKLPDNLGLGFGLYLGPRIRLVGPTLSVSPEKGSWSWVVELAFPPFAFLLTLASNQNPPGRGLMMNDWSLRALDEKVRFEGLVEVGFGWTPNPGDYRSSAAIRAEESSR